VSALAWPHKHLKKESHESLYECIVLSCWQLYTEILANYFAPANILVHSRPAILVGQSSRLLRSEMIPKGYAMSQMISENYVLFPSNLVLATLQTGNTYVDGTPLVLHADDIYTTQGVQYTFLFWNVNGEICTSNPTKDLLVPPTPFTASAWYATGGGIGPEQVLTWAFSADQNQTLPDVPILSVAPPGAWDGHSSNVQNKGSAVTIAARPNVPHDPGKMFLAWWPLSGGVASESNLTVPQGVFCAAIAVYGSDPCLSIKQRITGLQDQLNDINPPAVARALKEELRLQELALELCQKEHL
jgi:hypothetical protein